MMTMICDVVEASIMEKELERMTEKIFLIKTTKENPFFDSGIELTKEEILDILWCVGLHKTELVNGNRIFKKLERI